MAKMVDIEKLKPLLQPILTEENSTATIEGILAIAEDYDDEAVKKRTEEAVNSAKEEAKKEYSQKLHDMFFNGTSTEKGAVDDSNTDPEINNSSHTGDIEELFTPE